MLSGSTQPVTNEYQDISWGEGGLPAGNQTLIHRL
jgi:hypothetical protein